MKGLFKPKLCPLHGTFLLHRKYFGCKIVIRFSSTPLTVEQNNCMTETVSTYIIHDLDNLAKILRNNFTLKNCLFGVTNIVKNSGKAK